MKTILKKDELRRRSIEKPEESLELKHINAIVPVSEPMKVLLTELAGAVDEEGPTMMNMYRRMSAYNLVSFCISK